mmetsp:Transcript_4048/g.11739  ORF Transcript_4048/g.11739 Transcript_4048/m.11739 type:complete len:210 (+) Transcript_4048:926-1555(+)
MHRHVHTAVGHHLQLLREGEGRQIHHLGLEATRLRRLNQVLRACQPPPLPVVLVRPNDQGQHAQQPALCTRCTRPRAHHCIVAGRIGFQHFRLVPGVAQVPIACIPSGSAGESWSDAETLQQPPAKCHNNGPRHVRLCGCGGGVRGDADVVIAHTKHRGGSAEAGGKLRQHPRRQTGHVVKDWGRPVPWSVVNEHDLEGAALHAERLQC